MGEWLAVPGVDEVIAERINRFHFGFWGRRMRRRPAHSRCSDLFVHIDERDIANLNDVTPLVPLWECEIPLTDDGF